MLYVPAALKTAILNDKASFEARVQMTLESGTVINFNKTNILQNGGFKYETATSDSGKMSIGAAVTSKITLVIFDLDGVYKTYDFVGAQALVTVIATYPSGSSTTTYTIRLGYFLVSDDPVVNEKTLTITLYDYMCMLDKPYDASKVSYPTTAVSLLRTACTACGLTLYSSDVRAFENNGSDLARPAANITVNDPGFNSTTTWHDVVVYCCQMLNCMAIMRPASVNSLGIYAYSLPSTGLTIPAFLIKSLNKATIDTVITGLKITSRVTSITGDEADYMATRGSEGYMLEVSNNPLLNTQAGVNAAISAMWSDNPGKLNALTFRKLEADLLEIPMLRAGDAVKLTDADGVTYTTFVSHVTWTLGEGTKIVNDSESPSRHNLKHYSAAQKEAAMVRAIVEKWTAKEKTERQAAIEQLQDALDTSIDGLNGFFFTEETQSGGGKIYYYHNHPTMADSDIIWKMTGSAWGVSTDGGKTYTTGVTADGLAVTRMLSTIGLSASWINTGELTVKNSSGQITFYVNADTGAFNINSISGSYKTSMSGGEISFYENDSLTGWINARGLYFGDGSYGHIGFTARYYTYVPGTGSSWSTIKDALILTAGNNGKSVYIESGDSTIYIPKSKAAHVSTDLIFDGVLHFLDRYFTSDLPRPHIANWNTTYGIFQGLDDRDDSKRGTRDASPDAYEEGLAICAGSTRFYDQSEGSVMFNVTTTTLHAYETLNMHGSSITNQSDIRLKDHVGEYSGDVLKTLYKLELAGFDWRESQKHVSCGFIAQQFKEILPELVYEDENGILSIAEVDLIPYLVAAIQAIFRRIAPIEAAAIEVKKKWNLDDFGLTTFDALEAVRLERWARGIQGLMENDNSTTQEAGSNENEDV